MRSRAAVLHVGMHKTGTTSLQTMIARNRQHFRDQGLYYPTTGQIGVGDGQHNLAWELAGDERFEPASGTIADLASELRAQRRPRAVLVSSEDLEYLYDRPERLASLRGVLEDVGYAVRVVITLRQPSEYLESLYFELVAQGRASSVRRLRHRRPRAARVLLTGGHRPRLLAPDRGIRRGVRGPGGACAPL